MAALTLTTEMYRDKLLGAWQGKSAGLTLGAGLRGQMIPGRSNFYSPVPGQPTASVALDFPLVWLATLEATGPDVAPEDLAVAWLEHLDYSQDEFGYAALNLRRGLPPPASGAYSNWFRQNTAGMLRADLWGMLAPGAPQIAAAYAYRDSTLDHSEEGEWAAMFLAAVCSAAFFINDAFTLLTIGLAMIPKTCRTARAVKTALAAAQRAASWLEARESVLNEVGSKNFAEAPQNMGFLTIGLLYGSGEFGPSLCAAVNCGYDSEVVGGALGALLGIRRGRQNLPEEWMRPVGDIYIAGIGLRDFDAPRTLSGIAERTLNVGRQIVEARCPDVAIMDSDALILSAPLLSAPAETEDGTVPSPDDPKPSDATPELPTPAADSAAASGNFLELASADTPIDTAEPDFAPSAAEVAAPDLEETPASAEPKTQGVSEAAAPVLTDADAPPPAFRPQSVSSEEPAPITPGVTNTQVAAPIYAAAPPAADPVTAIAWTDNTIVKPLLVTPPNALVGQAGSFQVVMDTGAAPAIAHNQIKTLTFQVVNRGGPAFSGRIALLAPSGWQIGGPANVGQRQYIAENSGTYRAEFTVRVPEGQARIDIANAMTLRFIPEDGRPFEAEFVLMGAACWWTVGPFANFDGEGFDRSYAPEDRPGLNETYLNRLSQMSGWEKHTFPEATLDLEPLFKGGSGVCYGQTILRSPTARNARLVANTNSGVKVWLGGMLLLRRNQRDPFRPILGSGAWAADITLQAGDNPVLVKWVRSSEPYQFSLTVSDRSGRGLPEVGNTSW